MDAEPLEVPCPWAKPLLPHLALPYPPPTLRMHSLFPHQPASPRAEVLPPTFKTTYPGKGSNERANVRHNFELKVAEHGEPLQLPVSVQALGPFIAM